MNAEMNYTFGSVVTIGRDDYRVLPPHNLNALCEKCRFKIKGICEAPTSLPCAQPSRIYVQVTEKYRKRSKCSLWGFIKWIKNN